MPFEKKKKYKTIKDYKQKNLYLNESDPYQYECSKLLDLCGHKQARFVGMLVHEYIKKMGVDVESLDENGFKKLFLLLELQVSESMNNQPVQTNDVSQQVTDRKVASKESNMITHIGNMSKTMEHESEVDDEFIKEEDMAQMKEALAAFNIC